MNQEARFGPRACPKSGDLRSSSETLSETLSILAGFSDKVRDKVSDNKVHYKVLGFGFLGPALLITGVLISLPAILSAQTANPSSLAPTNAVAGSSWTTEQDHKNMMEQLGIT